MAIDPSIPLQYQAPQIQGPLDVYAKGQTLKGLMLQNEAGELSLEQKRQAITERNLLKSVLGNQQNYRKDESTGINVLTPEAMNQARAISPEAASDLEKDQSAAKAAALKSQDDAQKISMERVGVIGSFGKQWLEKRNELIAKGALPEQADAVIAPQFAAAVEQLKQNPLFPPEMRQQFNSQWDAKRVEQNVRQSMTVQEQYAQAEKERAWRNTPEGAAEALAKQNLEDAQEQDRLRAEEADRQDRFQEGNVIEERPLVPQGSVTPQPTAPTTTPTVPAQPSPAGQTYSVTGEGKGMMPAETVESTTPNTITEARIKTAYGTPPHGFKYTREGKLVPDPVVQAYELQKAQAGATNVVVQAGQKKIQELSAEQVMKIDQPAQAAQAMLRSQIKRARKLVNEGTIGGTAAEGRANVSTMLSTMGLLTKDQENVLANTKEYDKTINQFMVDYIQEKIFPQRVTNVDLQFLSTLTPQATYSKDARLRILDIMEYYNDYANKVTKARINWYHKHDGDLSDFEPPELEPFVDAHPEAQEAVKDYSEHFFQK